MKHLIEISILIIMYAMHQRNHLLATGKKTFIVAFHSKCD